MGDYLKGNQCAMLLQIALLSHVPHSLTHSMSNPKIPSKPPSHSHFPAFHDLPQVRKNQIAVHLLYVQIMKQFIKQLLQLHQSKHRSLFSSEQDIEKLYSAIKYYYNQSLSAYSHCVHQRESGEKKRVALMEGCKLEDKDCSFISQCNSLPFEMPDLFKNEYKPKIEYPYFHMNPPNLAFPKDEYEIKKDEEETSSNDSSEGEGHGYAERAEQLTNSLIIGDFMTNRIKRKPKEEKIFLQLQNVFLKLANNGRDTYYDRASIQLTNIDKSRVPIPLSAHP